MKYFKDKVVFGCGEKLPQFSIEITEEEYNQLCNHEISLTLTQAEQEIIDNKLEVERLKKELTDTDYKAIKFAEGEYTEQEYAPIRSHRQILRSKIKTLEGKING